MKLFFNNNLQKALKASKPEVIRRKKRIVKAIEIMIYVLTLVGTGCSMFGNVCISDSIGAGKIIRTDQMSYCKKFVLAGMIQLVIVKVVLTSFQYFSLIIIFNVAR